MEARVRETSMFRQIAAWTAPVFCLCLVACFQLGCATVKTRFGSAAHEPKHVFPSTRLAAQNVPDWLNKDEWQTGDLGAAVIFTAGAFVYALVELLPATVSDIILFPIDAYYVRKRERREKQRCVEGSEKR